MVAVAWQVAIITSTEQVAATVMAVEESASVFEVQESMAIAEDGKKHELGMLDVQLYG